MNYVKLLNFEVNRMAKVYGVLLLLTFALQFVGLFWSVTNYLSHVDDLIERGEVTATTYVEQYGPLDMLQILESIWFYAPIVICVGVMLFYIFLIWYRDWLGKNTFIYRLFMLPTARMNVLFAKATAIMLAVLGLTAFQYVMLIALSAVFQWLVPKEFRLDISLPELLNNHEYLQLVLPDTIPQFLLYYGAGFLFLIICFTIILLERSFRKKGIVIGILYALSIIGIFIAPLIVINMMIQRDILYPEEYVYAYVLLGVIVFAVSTWMSSYLIKHKVTV